MDRNKINKGSHVTIYTGQNIYNNNEFGAFIADSVYDWSR